MSTLQTVVCIVGSEIEPIISGFFESIIGNYKSRVVGTTLLL